MSPTESYMNPTDTSPAHCILLQSCPDMAWSAHKKILLCVSAYCDQWTLEPAAICQGQRFKRMPGLTAWLGAAQGQTTCLLRIDN